MPKQPAQISAYYADPQAKDKLIIAMAFDDNYLFPGLVSIFSARSNKSSSFYLIIAFDRQSLSEQSRHQIAQVCEAIDIQLEFIEIDLPDFLPAHGHLTAATWARLFLPQIIPSPFIYLDADIVCCPGWDELSRYLSSESHGVSGVRENADYSNQLNDAVTASNENYFNGGVLVFRPALLPDQFSHEVIEAAKNYKKHGFEWFDQDVLNFVLGGRVEILPPAFNVKVFPHTKSELYPKARILHFAGSQKPWTAIFRFRFFYTYSSRRWSRVAKKMLRTLRSQGVDILSLRLAFRCLAVRDGLDITKYKGLKRLALPAIRRIFANL